jgi:hypothetical protein
VSVFFTGIVEAGARVFFPVFGECMFTFVYCVQYVFGYWIQWDWRIIWWLGEGV